MVPTVAATVGLRVVHRASRFGGSVSKVLADGVVIATSAGERSFRFHDAGFLVAGKVVTLFAPRPAPPSGGGGVPQRTASGSLRAPGASRAKVARASRIWVEGIHDAALLERVWGDDLRDLGIVVERLDGIDDVVERVAAFAPGPNRALGVLVDHLVDGSKEARLAHELERRFAPYVLVRGTPYVDVWQAIRPVAAGIAAWPVVPVGEDWKSGICSRLGVGDPPAFWRRLLASVHDFTALEPPLVAAVESLLDHLTERDDRIP